MPSRMFEEHRMAEGCVSSCLLRREPHVLSTDARLWYDLWRQGEASNSSTADLLDLYPGIMG